MMVDWAWGGMGIGIFYMLLQLLFLVVLAVGVVLVVRHLMGGGEESSARSALERQGPPGQPANRGGSRALEILEERYARGDIDQDDFLSRKEDLLSGQGER